MNARRAIGIVVAVLACGVAVASAAAAPVPGATYIGTAADGATVKFAISPDGTLVDSYQLVGVQGNNCSFFANGDLGVWPGARIDAGAFNYRLRTEIVIRGSFHGPQSASGTFAFHQDATAQSPACDTGTVNWTASTTAAPRGGPGGPGSGSGGGHRPLATRITLRRSAKRLTGRVTSPVGACRVGRRVILWRGSRRIASTKAKAGGKFSFARSLTVRGRAVRASVPTRSVKAGVCAAASSTFIKG